MIKTSSDGPYNYEVISAVFRLAGTGSSGVKPYIWNVMVRSEKLEVKDLNKAGEITGNITTDDIDYFVVCSNIPPFKGF